MDLEEMGPARARLAQAESKVSNQPVVARSAVANASASPDDDLISSLNEDSVLALLKRRDLPPEILEQVSRNSAAMKSRKVGVALAAHPRTPRHLALRLLRQFYTLDLMQFALHPAVAA